MKSIFETTCGRCGTHWVKYIISQTLGFKVELPNVHDFSLPKGRQIEYPKAILEREKKSPGGYIYTYHVPIHNLHVIDKEVNILVLVRDPRDACVSSVFYDIMKGTFRENEFDSVLHRRLEVGGQYPEFFSSYVKNRLLIPHRILRYEDIVSDSYGTMKHVLKEFGYQFDYDKLRKSISQNTFFKLSNGRRKGDENKFHHYRKGVIGDWKNYLSLEDNQLFMERHSEMMEAFGYGKID